MPLSECALALAAGAAVDGVGVGVGVVALLAAALVSVGLLQPKLAHVREQRPPDLGQLDAVGHARHEFYLRRALQTAQALAERRRAQIKCFRGASQVAMLGDDGKVFDIAKFHIHFPRIHRTRISG